MVVSAFLPQVKQFDVIKGPVVLDWEVLRIWLRVLIKVMVVNFRFGQSVVAWVDGIVWSEWVVLSTDELVAAVDIVMIDEVSKGNHRRTWDAPAKTPCHN
jgi:hypothetical protein